MLFLNFIWDRFRIKVSFLFEGGKIDIRLWIIELEDYFVLEGILDVI